MTYSAIVTDAGGEYVGVQDGLIYFHDPQTLSTLTVRTKDLLEAPNPVEFVRLCLKHSREAFMLAQREEHDESRR